MISAKRDPEGWRKVASNMREWFRKEDGSLWLMSYNTVVAGIKDGHAVKTEMRWSATTSRHISKWIELRRASGMWLVEEYDLKTMPQGYFDQVKMGSPSI